MYSNTLNLWMPRLAAFFVAMLLAGSVVFWFLQWPRASKDRPLRVASSSTELAPMNPVDVARLLGQGEASAETVAVADPGSRFRLTGIIASAAGQGVALLSVDGKPAKPYSVGSSIEDGLMLQSVERRSVALASDARAAVRMRLELPATQ
ncbi:MAG: general secretion pathway protein C [Rhodoferax sp.]|nr:general secretion pathway protein C [Rhodoferax sp.]